MLFTLLVPVEVLQVGREGWHKEGRRLVNERRPTTKSKLITLLGGDSIGKKPAETQEDTCMNFKIGISFNYTFAWGVRSNFGFDFRPDFRPSFSVY